MNGFAFGQYYPAQSILHRLDPRIKLVMALIYVVTSFICQSLPAFLALLLSATLLVLISQIPFKTVLRSIRPVLFIMAFTAVINVFLSQGETALIDWRFVHIYLEGVYKAAFMMIRIFQRCMEIFLSQ